MRIREEEVTKELLDEIHVLFEKHAEELNILDTPLNVDRIRYIRSYNSGNLAAYIGREGGKIIGYAFYWLFRHPHYEIEVASQDILFIDKEHRKGRKGIQILKESESMLKEDHGTEVIFQHTKCHKPIDRLFERLGYREADKVYIKELI